MKKSASVFGLATLAVAASPAFAAQEDTRPTPSDGTEVCFQAPGPDEYIACRAKLDQCILAARAQTPDEDVIPACEKAIEKGL
jgi:hypothetical protein